MRANLEEIVAPLRQGQTTRSITSGIRTVWPWQKRGISSMRGIRQCGKSRFPRCYTAYSELGIHGVEVDFGSIYSI
jgi:hypothetical protein